MHALVNHAGLATAYAVPPMPSTRQTVARQGQLQHWRTQVLQMSMLQFLQSGQDSGLEELLGGGGPPPPDARCARGFGETAFAVLLA